MNAPDVLGYLFALQDRDLQLDRIREEQARLPEALVEVRQRWGALEVELTHLQQQLREHQLEFHRNDLEIKDMSAKQAKAREAQKAASSGQEQMQYENRIRQIGDRISELEDVGVPLMEEIERLETEVARVKSLQESTRPELELLEEENQHRVSTLEADLQDRLTERNKVAATIPASLVKEYEAIRKAKKGTGLARTTALGSATRCGACNVQLPPYVVQKVHQFNGQTPVRCPSCGRILWKGD